MKNYKRQIAILLTLFLTLAMLTTGCGSSSSFSSPSASGTKSYASQADTAFEEETMADYDAIEGEASEEGEEGEGDGINNTTLTVAKVTSRKIVRTVQTTLQTKEYLASVERIGALTQEYDGYYASAQVEGEYDANNQYPRARIAQFVIKIPSEKLDSFLDTIQEEFHVASLTESSEDITRSFYDNEATIKSLEERKVRLEGLLDATGDLETVLRLEQEIANTITEINILHSHQETMSGLIEMSTITIGLQEVLEFQETQTDPVSFGDRAGYSFRTAVSGFISSMQGLALFFIGNFPVLIFLALLCVAAFFIIRRIIKKSKIRAEELRKTTPQQAMFHPTMQQQQPQQPQQAMQPMPRQGQQQQQNTPVKPEPAPAKADVPEVTSAPNQDKKTDDKK